MIGPQRTQQRDVLIVGDLKGYQEEETCKEQAERERQLGKVWGRSNRSGQLQSKIQWLANPAEKKNSCKPQKVHINRLVHSGRPLWGGGLHLYHSQVSKPGARGMRKETKRKGHGFQVCWRRKFVADERKNIARVKDIWKSPEQMWPCTFQEKGEKSEKRENGTRFSSQVAKDTKWLDYIGKSLWGSTAQPLCWRVQGMLAISCNKQGLRNARRPQPSLPGSEVSHCAHALGVFRKLCI